MSDQHSENLTLATVGQPFGSTGRFLSTTVQEEHDNQGWSEKDKPVGAGTPRPLPTAGMRGRRDEGR